MAPGGAIVWLSCGIGPVPARPSGADSGGGAGREPAAIFAVSACADAVAAADDRPEEDEAAEDGAAEDGAAGVAAAPAASPGATAAKPGRRCGTPGRRACDWGTRNRGTRDRGTATGEPATGEPGNRGTRHGGTRGRHGLFLPPALLDRDRLPRRGHGLLVKGHLQALGGHPVRIAALLQPPDELVDLRVPHRGQLLPGLGLERGEEVVLGEQQVLGVVKRQPESRDPCRARPATGK